MARDGAGQLEPVRHRHVEVGENEAVAARHEQIERLLTVLGDVGVKPDDAELMEKHAAVDRVVFSQEQEASLSLGHFPAGQRSPQEQGGAPQIHSDPSLDVARIGDGKRGYQVQRGAPARCAVHGHVAAHQRRQGPGDHQSEPRPSRSGRSRRIGLSELVEQLPLLLRRDADPGIDDGELEPLDSSVVAQHPHGKGDAARLRELDRVST